MSLLKLFTISSLMQ
jgi:hypothetical protein